MKLKNLLIQAILLVFLYNCTSHYDSGKGIITNETWIKVDGNWKLKEDHFEVQEQFNNKKK